MYDLPASGLSDIDRAIIVRLQRDGRVPFRTLALDLGVTETTIYRRAQQLRASGYFQVIGVVNPRRLGGEYAVFAGINCEPAETSRVAASLAALPEVRFLAQVTGTYEIVCELVTQDRKHLTRLLVEILPGTAGLRTMNTSWVLHTYVSPYEWDIPAPAIRSATPGERTEEDELQGEAAPEGNPQAVDLPTISEMDLDGTDEEIVHLLQQNGRMSYAEIATALDLTESTARRRAMRLLQSNYVRVVAISNPFLLGFQDVVLMWVKVDLQRLRTVASAIAQQTPVRYLSRTAGGYDLVAEALFHDHDELFAFLNGPLAAIEGIRDVSISFELSLFKRGYRRFDLPRENE